MNPLLQLIEEQKKEFNNLAPYRTMNIHGINTRKWLQENPHLYYKEEYPESMWELSPDKVLDWHTSSIKALLQAQVEMLKDEIINLDLDNGKDRWNNGYLMSLQKQINLLVETINSIK